VIAGGGAQAWSACVDGGGDAAGMHEDGVGGAVAAYKDNEVDENGTSYGSSDTGTMATQLPCAQAKEAR
jgi:hypothetical protein